MWLFSRAWKMGTCILSTAIPNSFPLKITDYSCQKISNTTDLMSATGESNLLNAKLIGAEPEYDLCIFLKKVIWFYRRRIMLRSKRIIRS
jgi:hypothetical protein